MTKYILYVIINLCARGNLCAPFFKKEVCCMETFKKEKKISLINEQNNYYNEKLDELRLEKKYEEYKYAISMLKENYIIHGTYNTNICVYDKANMHTRYIKKEYFNDNLNDEEKEECYKKIKEYANIIPKAERLLREWSHSLTLISQNYYSDITLSTNAPCYAYLNHAICRVNSVSFSQNIPTPLQIGTFPKLNEKIEAIYASKEIVDFLYPLCDGDIKKLQELAKLSYNIIYNPTSCLSTVILASQEIHEPLKKYFDILAHSHFKNCYDELFWTDLKTLNLKEVRAAFLELELEKSFPFILVTGKTIYKIGESHAFFNKLFTGKPIPIDSPYFNDELIIKNTLPLIYITHDIEKYKTILNLYDTSVHIKINATEISVPDKFSASAEWLRREFLCIGLKQIKTNSKINVSSKIDHEAIVKNFLRICCSCGKNQICTKQELTDAYENYFKHFYPNEKSLGPIVFRKLVQKIKHNRIEECRPHGKRKGPYLTCFKYIGVKENYTELYQNEPVPTQETINRDKFEILLNKLVDETFKDVTFNKRKVKETVDISTIK